MKRINMVLVLLIGLLLLPNSVEKVEVDSLKYQTPANSAFDDDNFYRCVVDGYNNRNAYGHPIDQIDHAKTRAKDMGQSVQEKTHDSTQTATIKQSVIVEKLAETQHIIHMMTMKMIIQNLLLLTL